MGDITVVLLGDVSLNGRWDDPRNRPFHPDVVRYIRAHDVVLLNLESPVRGEAGENHLKIPRLSTSAAAVRGLRELQPTVCVVGNNHFFDQLSDGVSRTREAIRQIGAIPVGAALDRRDAAQPAVITRGGAELAVLSYVGAETHPSLPEDPGAFCNYLVPDRIEADVRRERNAGRFVVVSLHWGHSFHCYPSPLQRCVAARLVSAGAGLIWGHHAHVRQGWEIIASVPVFYSLGNSIFDDVRGIVWSEESRRSLLVSVRIHDGKVVPGSIRVTPVWQRHSGAPMEKANETGSLASLCRPLSRRGYAPFYVLYKTRVGVERARNYFMGPGRNPGMQLIRLPRRLAEGLSGFARS